jgi:hypothetical protein
VTRDEVGPTRPVGAGEPAEGEDTPARLRGRASRDDYESMCRLARALYRTGLGPREVLAECFGVALPEEFFIIAETQAHPDDDTPGYLTNLPWELAVPLEQGGPAARPSPMT